MKKIHSFLLISIISSNIFANNICASDEIPEDHRIKLSSASRKIHEKFKITNPETGEFIRYEYELSKDRTSKTDGIIVWDGTPQYKLCHISKLGFEKLKSEVEIGNIDFDITLSFITYSEIEGKSEGKKE